MTATLDAVTTTHRPHVIALAAVLAGLAGIPGARADPVLPVPCVAGSCGAGSTTFVTSGAASYVTSGTTGTVTQQTDRAILNWQSFDIGAGNTVTFLQPSSSSAALNRIFQADPSRILGALNANGQVYLINQNGIVFGQGAQVNSGALVASALNVSDDVFNDLGITGAINTPSGALAAFAGNPDPGASILVESGARLKSGERILLIAPVVENRGTIDASGGQVILAASQDRVYLASDEELRGLLVEVDTGGSVSNLGDIISERGNTTLVGLAVNQSGRIHATTTVNVNGSIRLLARDKAVAFPDPTNADARTVMASHTGSLTIGESSTTEVLPDLASTATAVDAQLQPQSAVEVMGSTIEVRQNARIVAPGGSVTLAAVSNPLTGLGDSATRIYLAEGSVIDVGGDKSTVVPMERNQASLKLFGNELADAPLQRDGPLARQEITVDLRVGTPLTDISRLRADIQRSVGERLSTGGQVSLTAGGDVILQPGSRVDISGGQVRYLDGYLETTQLETADGKIVDISRADPNVLYVGIVGQPQVKYDKWGVTETFANPAVGQYQPGYVEGKDAGSLSINAARIALSGDLQGNIVRGELQRDPATTTTEDFNRAYKEIPLGGALSLSGVSSLEFVNSAIPQSLAFSSPLAVDPLLLLSTQALRAAGINRLSAVASTSVSLPADVALDLGPAGQLTLAANSVRLAGDISIPSGTVTVTATAQGQQPGSLQVDATANVDVRGQWVNDLAEVNGGGAGTAARFIDGGKVTLNAQGDLALAAGSVVDVSAGAQMRANGAVVYGSAGAIALSSRIPGSNSPTTLDLGGELRGYGFGRGGQLKISAAAFDIGDLAGEVPGAVALAPEFFASGGFSAYSLVADRGSLVVADGTQLSLSPLSLQLGPEALAFGTGTDLRELTQLVQVPDWLRQPTSFSATLARSANVADANAQLRIGDGASIETQLGGSITLASDSDIYVGGELTAHGGAISLALNNPLPDNERGFLANQALRLGSGALLDASGAARVLVDDLGQRSGDTLAGGTVSLRATRGYVLTAAGSVINVSGTQQVLDLPDDVTGRLVPTVLSSDAGAVRVKTAEGALLFGELRGTPGGSGASGGSLSVTIDATGRDVNNVDESNSPAIVKFPTAPRVIAVTTVFPGDIAPNAAVPIGYNGQVIVAADRVRDGGFDIVDLTARPLTRSATNQQVLSVGTVRFDGDVTLQAGRRISLDASVITATGQAEVLAPYVAIGPTEDVLRVTPPPPVAGSGRLHVSADQIDLIGSSVLSGFQAGGSEPSIDLVSRGDIRMSGTLFSDSTATSLPGTLSSGADIRLTAAQLYPTTLSDFSINVVGNDGRIVVTGGGSTAPPLSAAGRLTLAAATITQGGVLRAPFGTIELDAAQILELTAGSVTSTSGAGVVVPFGVTELGESWVYPLGAAQQVLNGAPAKSIVLKAPDVAVSAGSTVDISGGGDLLTYEFVKGPGGSRDVLLGNNPEGAFAVVPGASLFGVNDPYESGSANIEVGSTIVLAGGSALPAGQYARLPARYALLPGAFLVVPVSGSQDIRPDAPVLLPDGLTPIVAGKLAVAGTSTVAARWSGYAILNGNEVRQRAEYTESLASSFFSAAGAGVPGDAGRLVIDAAHSILIDGRLTAATNSGGRAAQVDLLADNLALVSARTGTTNRVELVASELQNFGAASLLLGGSRSNDGNVTAISVRAQNVAVEGGVDLLAPDIILTATDSVTVAGNARLTGAGALDGEPQAFAIRGDGAFVRLSAGNQSVVERTAVAAQKGRVVIEAGATLEAQGSINLEASRDVVSNGDLLIHGGSLSFTTSLVSLGDAPAGTGGLVLSSSDLARFQAGELLLSSRSSIDIYGAVTADFSRLELDAGAIRGFGDGGESVAVSTDELLLGNSHGAVTNASGGGTGQLQLSARSILLNPGSIDISGFTTTQLTATGQILGVGQSQLHTHGDLLIETPRLSGATGADIALIADGALKTSALAAVDLLPPVTALGARLLLDARSVSHGAYVELPSGAITIHASGPEGITLESGSSLDASGRDIDYHLAAVGSPGGAVNLIADQGALSIGDGAAIDVSGAGRGGAAGKIAIRNLPGSVDIASGAILQGSAAAGQMQGSFELQAQSLTSEFDSLNAQLNAGGFAERRALDLRSGDVGIAAGTVVNARDFELAVDAGKIEVAGIINAGGAQGGRVRLSAGADIALLGTARIDARATAPGADGGTVELATRAGTLIIQASNTAGESIIDVAGSDAGGSRAVSGQVSLRAPRVGADGVAIVASAGSIAGAQRIDAEAFRVYDAATVDAVLINTVQGDTAAYMANASAIRNGLAIGADPNFHLRPGVEIASAGDLALNTAWDLASWRYGGEAGVLTLRATGDLTMNRSLSDGFAFQAPDGALPFGGPLPGRDVVQTGPSWSYRLVAGALSGGSDPLGVSHGSGNVGVGTAVFVRTGTGSIDIAAGQDVVLRSASSAVYTAGENRGTGALDPLDAEVFLQGDFVRNGGDIRVFAGRDVIGVTDRALPDWLPRIAGEQEVYNLLQGKPGLVLPTAWAINASKFVQGIGALGGGEVSIVAGGDLESLTVAVPTNGQPGAADGSDIRVDGGGRLSVDVAGDISGGVFAIGRGSADVHAGGSITHGSGNSAFPILQVGDASVALQGRGDVGIGIAFSATMAEPDPSQALAEFSFGMSAPYFSDYTERSAVDLTSIAGDTILARGDSLANTYTDLTRSPDLAGLTVMPGTLEARALQGNIRIGSNLDLMPSLSGQLLLLAAGDITTTSRSGSVNLSDGNLNLFPTAGNPTMGGVDGNLLRGLLTGHAATPVHNDDTVPALIVARDGTIGPGAGATLRFDIGKQTRLYAGQDISNLTLAIQNVRAGDVSVLEAGRDIVYSTTRRADGRLQENSNFVRVAGPGRVDLLAGRNVDFGTAVGVESIGNTANPALAQFGADIDIWTGQSTKPDYSAFIDKYLAASVDYGAQLRAYLATVPHDSGLSDVDAFRALSEVEQRSFLAQVLFGQLKKGGLDGFTAGFDAIKTLYPDTSPGAYAGSLKSFLSHITTIDGGSINIIVPNGLVNAGVASSGTISKRPEMLGVVVQRQGNVDAFVKSDFLVNASRVFALDGGDILIWSSEGNIDAGRGAKAALSIPPPVTTFDAQGNVVTVFPPAISGSGIRAAVSTAGRKAGDVFLFAPAGVVDAGDAGIASAGNITIVATRVIGADNIQVGGVAVGLPVDSGGLGASLQGVSSVGSSAANSATMAVESSGGDQQESSTPLADVALSWLDVFVIGLGEETCKPDDIECLKRNRKN